MTHPTAVAAMLEARSVAVVGASARPGSFGERLVTEVARSPSQPQVHLVNPRYDRVLGRPCLRSLEEIAGPVDLVLLGVGDAALVDQLDRAASRRDRSAVVFGSAWSVGDRLTTIARDAGMALCGAGCMGFVNLSRGVRALGYLEREVLPPGSVALVSHSGSAFSALLRSHRRIGFCVATSSGQELVTTTADYVDYALELPETRVLALLLETVREPARLRAALTRARGLDIPVVLLAMGGTAPGGQLVTAHSRKPVVVLSNMASSLDQVWASRLRAAGVPVLEGTRSGLLGLSHLLRLGEQPTATPPVVVDVDRRARWAGRLAAAPLSAADGFALLRDYGIAAVDVEPVRRRDDAVAAALRLGWPVVLKTDEAVAHKWDVGGVHLGLADVDAVGKAYDDLALRLGSRVLVSASAASGPELSLG